LKGLKEEKELEIEEFLKSAIGRPYQTFEIKITLESRRN